MLNVLTIAGSDSCGGAGIQADIQAIHDHGCHASTVISVLTAQNIRGVEAIESISPNFFRQQIDAVCRHTKFNSVKIGMLFSKDNMMVLLKAIDDWKLENIIIDPVMIATSGHSLIEGNAVEFLKKYLLPKALLVTPNFPEASRLLNEDFHDPEYAAEKLSLIYKTNVLIKGGHSTKNTANDVFYDYNRGDIHVFSGTKIMAKNTHGTGCRLSSAIAANYAISKNLKQSIKQAKNYVRQYLAR